MDDAPIAELMRASATRRILYLSHSVRQMSHPDRMITPDDVRQTVFNGDVIEDYPEDVRGHSCLVLGTDEVGSPIHVVCAPKEEYLAIITAYRPNPEQWSSDFRLRL